MTTIANIPVFQPYLGREVRDAVASALDAGWLGLGSLTKQFEGEIERYLGLTDRHVVATNSCTAALHLAAELVGLGPGDEVICPSFTYVAAHQAMTATGADVVFCDVEEEFLGVDPGAVRSLISDRTKAIMVCHFAGFPCRVDEINTLAAERGLRVIEDAAHAFGSRAGGRMIGSFGDLVCFSYGPVKVITTLEGGAVVTPHAGDVQVLHELRLIGVTADTDARYRDGRTWDYDVVRQGFRYHLGSVPSAIGLAQMAMLDRLIDSRRNACRAYNDRLAGLRGVRLFDSDYRDVSPFIYVIRVEDGATRSGLMKHLKERGIGSGIHFLGAHDFSFYRHARRGDLTVTERASEQVVTLPLHQFMDEAVVDAVAAAVRDYFS